MTTLLPCAEDMQRVAEVRAREVARQQRKRMIGNVIEGTLIGLAWAFVLTVLLGALMQRFAPDALASALEVLS